MKIEIAFDLGNKVFFAFGGVTPLKKGVVTKIEICKSALGKRVTYYTITIGKTPYAVSEGDMYPSVVAYYEEKITGLKEKLKELEKFREEAEKDLKGTERDLSELK